MSESTFTNNSTKAAEGKANSQNHCVGNDQVTQQVWTQSEIASRLRISLRQFQRFLLTLKTTQPSESFYRTLGRRKLFTEGDFIRLVAALPDNSTTVGDSRTAPGEDS